MNWAEHYRQQLRNADLLEREWLGMPPGILADAMLSGSIALRVSADHAVRCALATGQILGCYP